MIIDAHVSIDESRYSVERAMRALEASSISRAVVFADAHSSSIDAQNRYVLRVSEAFDLIPFWYVGGNPWCDTRPDGLLAPDNLDEYAGIRWHRWIGEGLDREGNYDADEMDWALGLMESAEFEAFTAAAAHYDLPVMFEESFAVTLEFVTRYPSLDVILPHLGARSGGEAKVLRALWDAPNVYFDTSLAYLDETFLGRVGSGRILFGSAFPEGDTEREVEKIDGLPVSDEIKEGIFGDNLLALLQRQA